MNKKRNNNNNNKLNITVVKIYYQNVNHHVVVPVVGVVQYLHVIKENQLLIHKHFKIHFISK